MKILYDYQAFSRQLYGGVSRYFVELARRLSITEKTKVQVLAPLYINRYLTELDPGIVSGRQLAWAPKASGKLMNIYNRASSHNRIAAFGPDIVHETYFAQRPVSPRSKGQRIITVHDMIHERYPEYFPSWDNTAANKRSAIKHAAHIICVSENTRRDLIEIENVDANKLSVVHHGFNSIIPRATETKPLIVEPYLLHVGIRTGYKNFKRLLSAYAGSSDLRDNYRLVCFGGGKFERSEEREKKKYGLSNDSLVWMGGSDSVLHQLYRHAAALVCPSLYEGFGITPLEAMARNCPVVCSNGGSTPEVVGDAGEFFDPEDTSAIASAIKNVVCSDKRSAELRALGRHRITRFSWAKCARDTHAVYSAML